LRSIKSSIKILVFLIVVLIILSISILYYNILTPLARYTSCVTGNVIIQDTNYPTGSCQSPAGYKWSHSTCGSTNICKQNYCKSINANVTSYKLTSSKYARSDMMNLNFTIKNIGDITWCFYTETGLTKSDSSGAWPGKFNSLAAGFSLSDSLTYQISCSDPLGSWSGFIHTYTDYSKYGGWKVWGTPSYSFEVVECLNDQDCVNCVGSDYACNSTNRCNKKLAITAGGLKGEYYDNINFTNLKITRTDPIINFSWGSNSPDPSMGVDTFSVRWQGYVKADYAETYTFYVTTDDGSRIWIDNNLIINSWINQQATERSGTITLTKDWHTIKYDYYENTSSATAKLSYSSPSVSKRIIPSDHLGLQACIDGTAYNSCSNVNKPSWCDSTGNLIANQCGSSRHNCSCPSGQTCNATLGSCYQNCSDGTAYNKCSSNQPKYCSSGTLINKCGQCGCPYGQNCNATADTCYTPKLDIRGYVFATYSWTAQNYVDRTDSLQAHYDFTPSILQQIPSLEPSFIRLLYRNVREIYQSEFNNGVDGVPFNKAWLLKDASGNYVRKGGTNYMVDITNPDYQQWVANWYYNHITNLNPYFDGFFLDNGLYPTEGNWHYGASGEPVKPGTTRAFTTDEIVNAYVNIYKAIKNKNPNRVMIANGIGTGGRWMRWGVKDNYIKLATETGFMTEFWLSNWENSLTDSKWIYYSEDYLQNSDYNWKDSIDMLVEVGDMFSGKYIVVVAQVADDHYDWDPILPSPLTTTAEKQQYCIYNYASLLLAASTNNTYLVSLGLWGATNIQYLWKTDVGSPSGSYYMISGTRVYARNFSKAKVLVNPSNNSYTVPVGSGYKYLNGTSAPSNITMKAHTGEILLKV